MSFTLDKIVPWGRSFDEYVAMFALSDGDLQKRILGCGDGPASFNAVLTRRGGRVVSLDPLYAFSDGEIRRRIAETYSEVMEQTVTARLAADGYGVTVVTVPYEFQRGGNQMMRIGSQV